MKTKNQNEDFDDFDEPLPKKELSLEDMNRLAISSGGVAEFPNSTISGVLEVPKQLVHECSVPVVANINNELLQDQINKIAVTTKEEIFQRNIPKVNDDIIKRWLDLKPNDEVEATIKGTVVAVYKKNNPYPTLLLRTRGGLKHLYPDDEAVILRRLPKKSG